MSQNLLMPPTLRKKIPWLNSFSEVLNLRGLLNEVNFSRTGLPSGRASLGRFFNCMTKDDIESHALKKVTDPLGFKTFKSLVWV